MVGEDKKRIDKRKILAEGILVALVVAFAFFSVMWRALFEKGVSGGIATDVHFHFLRIVGIRDQLLTGEYPKGILSSFFGGYGYGCSFFYPDYFLLIPALMMIAGFDLIIAYKAFVGIVTVAIALSSYFSFRYISKNRYVAAMVSILLCTSIYYLVVIWDITALQEYIAFIFVPILLAGLHDIWKKEQTCRIWLIGIGLGGLLLTHTITCFLGVCVTAFVYAVHLKTLLKDKKILKETGIVALLTLLCTAFYYMPMIEQLFAQDLRVFYPWARLSDMTVPFWKLFSSTGYCLSTGYIGIGRPILFAAAIVLCNKRCYTEKSEGWGYIIAGGILMVLMTNLFPWKLLENTIINSIQYTYRLYSYALIFLLLGLFMKIWHIYGKKQKQLIGITVLLLLLSVFHTGLQLNGHYGAKDFTVGMPADYYEAIENSSGNVVGAGEWLPQRLDTSKCCLQDTIITERGEMPAVYDKERPTTAVACYNDVGATILEFPKIWYKGYTASVLTTDHGKIDLEVVCSESGLVEVHNPQQYRGKIEVHYEQTPAALAGKCLTGIGLLGILCYGINKRKNRISEKQ